MLTDPTFMVARRYDQTSIEYWIAGNRVSARRFLYVAFTRRNAWMLRCFFDWT